MLLPPGVPDFKIQPAGPVSAVFLERGCATFAAAAQWVRQLPYRRISNRNNAQLVFSEGCGTCSSKHAVLQQLAEEQGQRGFMLMIGMYAMDGDNTPPVKDILEAAGLETLPEAHCYIRYESAVLDCTGQRWSASNFLPYLLREFPIPAAFAGHYKEQLHRDYLNRWLADRPDLQHLTIDDLWAVREQCIQALS